MATEGPDSIDGTTSNDTIDGLGGNDSIRGLQGDDLIRGGADNDRLGGGGGDDTLMGGAGFDVLYGGPGRDTASWADATSAVVAKLNVDGYGQAGTTIYKYMENLAGSAFDDVLMGNLKANQLSGGDGDDLLYATARARDADGDDTFVGGAGFDTAFIRVADLNDTSRFDSIEKVVGSDLIGDGADNWLVGLTLDGGAGDDLLGLSGSGGSVAGGGGIDTLSFADYTRHGSASLALTGPQDIGGGRMVDISGIENLVGNDRENTLVGGAGDNLLDGAGGDDKLSGGAGSDTLIGGDGDDRLQGGRGADRMEGGAGADTFIYLDLDGMSATAPYDTIRDLAGEDVIDLSGIDADETQGGDQAFILVNGGGHAGEMTLVYNAEKDVTWLSLYVDDVAGFDGRIGLVGDQTGHTNFVF